MFCVRWSDQYVFKAVNGELRWVEVLAGASGPYRSPESLARYLAGLDQCWPGLIAEIVPGNVAISAPAGPPPAPSRKGPFVSSNNNNNSRSRFRRGPAPRKPLPCPPIAVETCAGGPPVALRRRVS